MQYSILHINLEKDIVLVNLDVLCFVLLSF